MADMSDIPEPSHRHPMSGEKIWDEEAVKRVWNYALTRAAIEIVGLKTSHAHDSNEPLDDPECSFQTAWNDAIGLMNALKIS